MSAKIGDKQIESYYKCLNSSSTEYRRSSDKKSLGEVLRLNSDRCREFYSV